MGRQASTLDVPLSELFPDLFKIARALTAADQPLVLAASLLFVGDAPMLPVIRTGPPATRDADGVRLFQAVGTYPIIRRIVETAPVDYYSMLWDRCDTTVVWIGTVGYEESFERLLQVLVSTRFGTARVESSRPPPALLTLAEITALYGTGRLASELTADEVGSPLVSVDPGAPLFEALLAMCKHMVRTVHVAGEEQRFITDRDVLGYLFSPDGLRRARDDTESWLHSEVRDVPSKRSALIKGSLGVADVARLLDKGQNACLLTDSGKVVSRWDLVIKPYEKGVLRLAR